MHTSSNAGPFTELINAELLARVNNRISTFHKPSARGNIRDSKDALFSTNKVHRERPEELEQLKVKEIDTPRGHCH